MRQYTLTCINPKSEVPNEIVQPKPKPHNIQLVEHSLRCSGRFVGGQIPKHRQAYTFDLFLRALQRVVNV